MELIEEAGSFSFSFGRLASKIQKIIGAEGRDQLFLFVLLSRQERLLLLYNFVLRRWIVWEGEGLGVEQF